VDDQSDAKSAVEKLAQQLFTVEQLCSSLVTGFRCTKDYQARPALSPRRRDLLESKLELLNLFKSNLLITEEDVIHIAEQQSYFQRILII